MDKLSKRVMYNPNGSSMMMRWNDSVVVKGKQETAFGSNSTVSWNSSERNAVDIQLMDELEGGYLDEIGYNWETEIDYY